MQGEVLLFSALILPYSRLENVTNSVTNTDTPLFFVEELPP